MGRREGRAASDAPIVSYVKHKPGQSLMIGFETMLAETANSSAARGHAVRWNDPQAAIQAFDKSLTLRQAPSELGFSVELIDDHTVAWAFPNDPRLRTLRWILEPRKIKRTFAELTGGNRIRSSSTACVLSYKPQRRLVARVDLNLVSKQSRSLVVRCSSPASVAHTLQASHLLVDQGIATPRPLGAVLDGYGAVTEFVPGTDLHLAIDEAPVATATALVDLVNRLGQIEADGPTVTWLSESRRRIAELNQLQVDRQQADAARRALELGPSRSTASVHPTRTVHGDLSLDNVIATAEGLVLIDLERVARGPAALDLATLLASCDAAQLRGPRSRARELFADTLIDLSQEIAGPAELGWFRGAALIGAATRHQRTNFAADVSYTAALVDLACDLLTSCDR